MFTHMPRDSTGVGIVAPARCVTDSDADSLTLEEVISRSRTPRYRQKNETQRHYVAVNWLSHIGLLIFLCAREKRGSLWLWGVWKGSVPPDFRLLHPKRTRYR